MSNNDKGFSAVSAIKVDGILDYAMYPNDTIPEGYVCVFDNTSGDNKSAVLPNNALALNSGKAFAGICATFGPAIINVDNQFIVQKLGIAKCALKANQAVTRGQTIAYDPADGGLVVPYSSPKQIPIGVAQQTVASSTSMLMIGVELHAQAARGSGLVGAIVTSSSAITGSSEVAFDQSVTVPANTLVAGAVLKITAKVRQTAVNGTDTLLTRVRFGGLAGVVLGLVPATAGAVGGLSTFELAMTVRSATTATSGGFGGIISTVVPTGSVGTLTIDTTIANAIVVTGIFSSANAGNTAVLEDLTVTLSSPLA